MKRFHDNWVKKFSLKKIVEIENGIFFCIFFCEIFLVEKSFFFVQKKIVFLLLLSLPSLLGRKVGVSYHLII